MNSWKLRYELLSQRERLLIVSTLVAVIYIAFTFLVFGSLDSTQSTREQELKTLEQQKIQFDAELKLFSSLLNTDPDKAKKQQIRTLKAQMLQIEGSLNRLSVGLIPADELPILLKKVLQQTKTLRLQSIQTLPVSELSLQGEVIEPEAVDDPSSDPSEFQYDDAAESNKVETAGVFKHAVVMQLSGGFFETKQFIEALEALPWRLYWDSLEYSVSQYPSAIITLQVYTLSTDEGAFGEKS